MNRTHTLWFSGIAVTFVAVLFPACSGTHEQDELGTSTQALTPAVIVGSSNFSVLDEAAHPGSSGEIQSEQSLAVVGNRIVVGYNDFTGQVDSNGNFLTNTYSLMGVAYTTSLSGGDVWHVLPQITSNAPNGCGIDGDPWLAANHSHSHLWYVNMASCSYGGGLFVADSSDGVSWSPARYINIGVPVDKPSIAVDPSNDSNVFIAYRTTQNQIYVIRSANGGQAWYPPVNVNVQNSNVQNPIIQVYQDSLNTYHVMVMYEDSDNPPLIGLHMAKGDAQAQQFSVYNIASGIRPATVLAAQPTGHVGNSRIISTFAVFPGTPANNKLYVAWADSNFNGAIKLASSQFGSSWTTTYPVGQPRTPVVRFRVQLATAGNNVLEAALAWDQQDTGSAATRVFATTSYDLASWNTPFELTKSTPPGFVYPFVPCVDLGSWFGDYIGLVGRDKNVGGVPHAEFVAAWSDSRLGCVIGQYGVHFNKALHQHTMTNFFGDW